MKPLIPLRVRNWLILLCSRNRTVIANTHVRDGVVHVSEDGLLKNVYVTQGGTRR